MNNIDSNHTSNGACNFATLSTYNQLGNPAMISNPSIPLTTGVGYTVVPAYSAIGYDALTHGGHGSCSGFFNITQAYGSNANNCQTQYIKRLCA